MEKEKVGTNHLRTVPILTKTVDTNVNHIDDLHTPSAGFYMPQTKVNLLLLN